MNYVFFFLLQLVQEGENKQRILMVSFGHLYTGEMTLNF